jgi:membrane protein implicated in regulation of membrane protease activity
MTAAIILTAAYLIGTLAIIVGFSVDAARTQERYAHAWVTALILFTPLAFVAYLVWRKPTTAELAREAAVREAYSHA